MKRGAARRGSGAGSGAPRRESFPGRLVLLTRAFHAVSTSPPMEGHARYVSLVEAVREPPQGSNREPYLLGHRMLRQLTRIWNRLEAAPRLPWTRSEPEWDRLVVALVSFVDDYRGSYPGEFFPKGVCQLLLGDLEAAARRRGRALDLVEQFDVALERVGPQPFAAAVALHATTRQVARARDCRALPGLVGSVEERVRGGRMLSAISDTVSRGGDPLGDTYHYWANFLVGYFAAWSRGHAPRRSQALEALFYIGPDLMSLVRDRLNGSVLFFGTHAVVDRLALSQGRLIAEALTLEEDPADGRGRRPADGRERRPADGRGRRPVDGGAWPSTRRPPGPRTRPEGRL